MIDLRSDTVTRPTERMREIMAGAEVGDDVFGEDPGINQLQEEVAGLLGKESALFVPSGTMANQIGVKVNTQPGDEVILDIGAHIFNYEGGAAGMLSGVQLRTLPGQHGILSREQVEAAIRPAMGSHNPNTKLICLENTHNRAGGVVYPIETIKAVHAVARKHRLRMHLDGARLWNASVATGIPLKKYAEYFDTVSVCFSKGLGAPVGSAIAGSKENMAYAHRIRKVFGGGMRQAGIIASAALYAVRNHFERLKEDHAHCKLLAEGLSRIPAIRVDLDLVHTNILFFEVRHEKYTAQSLSVALQNKGVHMLALSPHRIRAVTHLDVNQADILKTLDIFNQLLL